MVATRFFRGALAPYQYIYVSARFETAVETVKLSRYARLCYISAKFAPYPIAFPCVA